MALWRDVRYQVQYRVTFVGDGKPGQGITFNLSRGGCAIDTDAYQPTPIAIDLGKGSAGHAARAGWNSW